MARTSSALIRLLQRPDSVDIDSGMPAALTCSASPVRLTTLWFCLPLTSHRILASESRSILTSIYQLNSTNRNLAVALIHFLYNVGPIEDSGYLNPKQSEDFGALRRKIDETRKTRFQLVYFVCIFSVTNIYWYSFHLTEFSVSGLIYAGLAHFLQRLKANPDIRVIQGFVDHGFVVGNLVKEMYSKRKLHIT